MTGFYPSRPPPGTMTGQVLKRGLSADIQDVTGSGVPRRVEVDPGYVGLEDAWARPEGTDEVTRKFLDPINDPQYPGVRQKLNTDQRLARRAADSAGARRGVVSLYGTCWFRRSASSPGDCEGAGLD